MERDQAKELLPIIRAYSEGKAIQLQHIDGTWQDAKYLNLGRGLIYRIKPEVKYRPFKDAKECWAEMQKHQPFGWVTFDCDTKRRNISSLLFRNTLGNKWIELSNGEWLSPYNMFKTMKFIDGTPFGVKEEE